MRAVSTGRLSPTSYVVLGMIGLRGPSTPYDLKRGIGRSVGYFWPFPHAQLYAEPERLERMGLLAVQPEDSGRRRKTYSLTESGRNELREWLAAPTNEHFQMRDIAELKLFFNELGDPGNVARLAREQVSQHQQRIAVYEEMQARAGERPAVARRMATARLGLEMEHAALRFWRSLADSTDGSDRAGAAESCSDGAGAAEEGGSDGAGAAEEGDSDRAGAAVLGQTGRTWRGPGREGRSVLRGHAAGEAVIGHILRDLTGFIGAPGWQRNQARGEHVPVTEPAADGLLRPPAP
jgi:PadR family transcriptional regulator, regulatory protein AphA